MIVFNRVLFNLVLLLLGLVSAFQKFSFHQYQCQSAPYSAIKTTPENIEFGLKPRVQIEYCPGCKWMMRSAWMAQELLSTFEKEIREVALVPSPASGTFTISIDKVLIWDRRDPATPGFPDIKDLKKRVRDLVDPERDLGHSDR